MKKGLCLILVGLFLLNSCLVSKKKFDEQKALAEQYLKEKNDCNDALSKSNNLAESTQNKLTALQSDYDKVLAEKNELDVKNAKLKKDISEQERQLKKLQDEFNILSQSSSKELDKMSKMLSDKQKELSEKEQRLDQQQKKADMLAESLKSREERVRELEQLIARKDSAVLALKKKISDALTGFNSSELQVSQRDGKVYVSMSDKLLFQTGSFMVDAKGKGAIMKISEVLNKQSDIGIVVEGHTDNKAYISADGNIKNNWDLSVMRASSVTFLMAQEGKVDPKRIEASGRGEFNPVAPNDTPEGRAKNRRIEIILSPDLRGIFEVLNAGN